MMKNGHDLGQKLAEKIPPFQKKKKMLQRKLTVGE